MKTILTVLGILLIWTGVAIIAETWVTSTLFGLYKHWQFYVTLVFFSISASLFEEIGRRR